MNQLRDLGIASLAILLVALQMGSSASYVGFGFLAILSICLVLRSGSQRRTLLQLIRETRAFWLVLVLFVVIAVLVMLFQGVVATRSWGELKWIFFLIAFLPVSLVAVSQFEERGGHTRRAAYILFGMTCFSAFAAIYQFATGTDPFREFLFGKEGWGNRGHGLLRNPVPFAKLMGSLSFIGFSGALVAQACGKRRLAIFSLGFALAAAAALLSSQARGAWLAIAAAGVVGVFGVPRIFRRKWIVTILLCGLVGILAIATVPALSARAKMIFTDNASKSNQTRLEQWHINWCILRENPMGVGFDGNDRREDYYYEKLGYEKRVTGHCHNEFIEIAVATGWLGILGYAGLTFIPLWLCFSVLRRIDVKEEPWLGFLLLSSFLVQLFLNAAVMTDQMDTQSRLIMSLCWTVALVGWFEFGKKGAALEKS
ncbi:MAG: O-antigen ligase family protein [Verrucomicrobiales bacterium]|nr:O-antigen ligase family protein [Verrucomicrobiales bacterium]